MFVDALAALRQIFSPPFRTVLWKVLVLTLVLLVMAGLVLHRMFDQQLMPSDPWLALLVSTLSGLGLLIGMIFLVPPASSLVAGFFLDELAEQVECEIYPAAEIGRALPAGQALWLAIRFTLLSLVVNAGALLLLLAPGVNATVFLVANAYLLGREYFELAALRYLPMKEALELRRQNSLRLFFAGFFIAVFVIVPGINLLTPLFGTAFMVRYAKRLRQETDRIA